MCLLSPCAGSFFNHQTLNINLFIGLLLQLSMECHSDFHISWYFLKIFKIQNNFLKFVDSMAILILHCSYPFIQQNVLSVYYLPGTLFCALRIYQ